MSDEQKTSVSNEPTTPKPARPECHPENLPQALKAGGKFCNWKYIWKENRWTKAPYNPRTGRGASSTDPKTFADYDGAVSMIDRYDGIGAGIFGNLGAIDIDHCVNDNGDLTPEAADIVETMNAYTEVSPSGHGIRILFSVSNFKYDTKKYYINNQKAGIEIYIAGQPRNMSP